ncbi:MAG: serine acetyltransferase [Kiritimatiellae bacterium]|nr:serine acetyltransferase [Kiritimatiellia bacterium]
MEERPADWFEERGAAWEDALRECPACPIRERTGDVEADPALPTAEKAEKLLSALVALCAPVCSGERGVVRLPRGRAADAARALHDAVLPLRRHWCREVLRDDALADRAGDFAREATEAFMASVPDVRRVLREDVVAAYEGDPAARSEMEVVLSYPGFRAIAAHRVAHRLLELGVPLLPRVLSESAHSHTGIDIHPGATIGPGFFIDHGTGVVIGETCTIGRRVKLYQGVTLGALSFDKDENGNLVKGVKRHPDVEDNVVVYAGATILGGRTKIGHDSVIGGNVWLVHSVPPHSKVLNAQPSPRVRTPGVPDAEDFLEGGGI